MTWFGWVLLGLVTAAVVIGLPWVSAVTRRREERRAAITRELELVDTYDNQPVGEATSDWGLDEKLLWRDATPFEPGDVDASAQLGCITWRHETVRDGRALLVAEEVHHQESPHDASHRFVVAIHVAKRVRWFATRGRELGSIPAAAGKVLRRALTDYAMTAMAYRGVLVLRFVDQENIDEAIADCLLVAAELDGKRIKAAPEPVPTTWQQPPAEDA